MDELRGIIPRKWWVDNEPPSFIQEIVVNWLYREVDMQAEIKMPVLQAIHGHRNIEVYYYLQDTWEYRDRQIAINLYGMKP